MNTHKIIFINRFFYPDHSATSQILSDLAFYLAESGLSISVICSSQSYDNKKVVLPTIERIKNVDVYRVTTTNFGRNWLPGRVIDYMSYFLGMIWILIKITKQGDVVVTKTDPPLTSVLTLPIAKLKKARHVNWVQDLFPEVAEGLGIKYIPAPISNFLRSCRNWSFRHSQLNIVIGERMKQRLVDQKMSSKNICVIPNWANNLQITPVSKSKNQLRKAWELEDKFVLLYSGNMGRVHEFDTIINAAKLLRERREIVFLFVGGGPQKSAVEKLVKDNSLSNILFKPYQDYSNLSMSLSLADLHLVSLKPVIEGSCVPSKYYGIISVGRPVLFIGDVFGEIATMLNEDKCGVAIPEGNDVLLADTIVALAADSVTLENMAQNALQAVSTKYDIRVSLAKWKLAIESLAMN